MIQCTDENSYTLHRELHTGGILPEKLGRGVRPASQNPYPIYDRNGGKMAKIDTLFMTKTAKKP